jgi:dUTP diphosphatase
VTVTVGVRRVRQGARLPRYAHSASEDAGLDLSYCGDEPLAIPPHEWLSCPTGIALELPAGYEGQVRPRSGLALNRGITVLNTPGTIDPGYRGEVCVLLWNVSDREQVIMPGDRVAQLVISTYAAVQLVIREDLSGTSRDEDGFGSTGK